MSSNVMKIGISFACMILCLTIAFLTNDIILSYLNTIIVILIGLFVFKNNSK